MKASLDWARDGRQWPLHDNSTFVMSSGLRWHVQQMGRGPDLVLLHGVAASTHSFRDLAPLLASRYRVTMMDLPGHAFTSGHRARDLTLPNMADLIGRLIADLKLKPVGIVGHSAGAAIGARALLGGGIHAPVLIGINAALMPFPGAAGKLFPSMARALFLNPFAPVFFASQVSGRSVARLLEGTGSHLDETGRGYYRQLLGTSAHLAAVIGMMAQWDLVSLLDDLSSLPAQLVLIVGDGDRAVPPSQADEIANRIGNVRVVHMANYGHLVHEEAASRVNAIIEKTLSQVLEDA